MRERATIVIAAITMLVWLVPKNQIAQAASPYPVIQGKIYKFEKVAEGIYYATGGLGSNNVIIVNDRDVMLVDDGATPSTARALLLDMKLLTDKPVRYVVNTHFHYDHTNGNSVFPTEVDIIAHEYVRTVIVPSLALERDPVVQGMRVSALVGSLQKEVAVEKDAGRKATLEKELAMAQMYMDGIKEARPIPPNVTYASKLILYMGQREVQLLFLGRAHTGGDTVVYLPKERIVCTGDVMENRIGHMDGGSFYGEWIATLDALKKLDFTLMLPGHGTPFSDKNLIAGFQSYLLDITNQAAALRKQGVSPEAAAQRIDLASHLNEFPQMQRSGAPLIAVRGIYEWIGQRGDQ